MSREYAFKMVQAMELVSTEVDMNRYMNELHEIFTLKPTSFEIQKRKRLFRVWGRGLARKTYTVSCVGKICIKCQDNHFRDKPRESQSHY